MSATSGHISIISFKSVIGVPLGITGASFSIALSLITRIIKKLLKITRNKKKKTNMIVTLVKSKLNRIKTLISQALIDLTISHEKFKTIVNEKDKYEEMKGNIRNIKSNYEKNKLSEKSRNNTKNSEITLI